jgi:hypothetical protein
VASGWGLAAGGWRLGAGGWWLAAGGWRLVAGGWRLVAGGWWLVAGGWWLVAGAPALAPLASGSAEPGGQPKRKLQLLLTSHQSLATSHYRMPASLKLK